jgi:hypothetical protein
MPITFLLNLSLVVGQQPHRAGAGAKPARRATACSDIERGNQWFVKGDYQRALADL